jgi:hypothetical protein
MRLLTEHSSLLVVVQDAQARVISDTLSPNSTQKDIALASAKTAIIYQ